VCRLIESLGAEKKVRIVGHDWGGFVAWHLAATRPELCERLAVLNIPHPQMIRRRLFRLSQLKRSWYIGLFQIPLLPERWLTENDAAAVARVLKSHATDRTHFSDQELRPFRDAIQKPGAAKAMLGWYRAAWRVMGRGRYPKIDADTLIIWGKKDFALGFDDLVPGTEAWVSKLNVVPIENAGHFVQSEAPTAVNKALLDFLS
jgi:pimeloyl-ACP methyl ester carboxylesterase